MTIGEIISLVADIVWVASFVLLAYCNLTLIKQNAELLSWIESQEDTIALLNARLEGRSLK